MEMRVLLLQGIVYQRYLYLKEHEGEGAKNTALFVAGIPFFHQDIRTILQELFEGFGSVQDLALHPSKVHARQTQDYSYCSFCSTLSSGQC